MSTLPLVEILSISDSRSYARPQNMKMQIIVMPAWIAGIQVHKDASGSIHDNLDSSTPCWNECAREGATLAR